ncbi:cytochrome d ubiquinol oxidase subunit II [Candidatus Nucleicultrix amoebiphila]|uniref:Cytochrome d ubiquinol oxidase subunit 2 n=1 Tax=Candidatus Nucleicultrix amoebiphila FS5 TaxID=1414854 RepID=A0A1W6N4N3_9PROT|nr:cytochrome d ubiquinol oxidase subunit II [Candidatus Nucleicultrix amoebiphila]ARN84840.1 cytochrome d ubiquinol oxidase subunit 2 [Candidatus Nucleicultrix amoebiphila FS5]
MLDFETLRLIWWVLLGVLLIGFAILDGFDLGAAMWLPFLGKKDEERRIIINTVGPVWEGNQVWLILGGGASFAAWPFVYAASFSGFYIAIFLSLFAVILRPVGFKFRSKMPSSTWRETWDWLLFVGGLVPALIFGVAVGNLFMGAPFHFDETLRLAYTGSFWQLLTPFPVLCGLMSIAMMLFQGGIYLSLKTTGALSSRAHRGSLFAGFAMLVLFIIGGFWLYQGIEGYQITSAINTAASSNPIDKQVSKEFGLWFHNYGVQPKLYLIPGLGCLSILGAIFLVNAKKYGWAFLSNSVAIFCVISSVGVSLFPFIMPSSSEPNHSLTVWDASSSQRTLMVMLLAVLIFLPIILAYTAWVYRVLRGKVTNKSLEENKTNAY